MSDVSTNDPVVMIPEEIVPLDSLTPHPRNYRNHPEDQLAQIRAALRLNGWTRNVVVADDSTILAGHGVVEAARSMGVTDVPVRRLPISPDSPAAIRIVTGDNELGRFAEVDDRALSELLRELSGDADGLDGTGYTDMMLANLVMTTRFESEIPNFDAAAEWVGMPDYTPEGDVLKITVSFRDETDRQTFIDEFGLREALVLSPGRGPRTYSAWWPAQTEVRHDGGLRYSQDDAEGEGEPEA